MSTQTQTAAPPEMTEKQKGIIVDALHLWLAQIQKGKHVMAGTGRPAVVGRSVRKTQTEIEIEEILRLPQFT